VSRCFITVKYGGIFKKKICCKGYAGWRRDMSGRLLKQTGAGEYLLGDGRERWECGMFDGLLRLCFKGRQHIFPSPMAPGRCCIALPQISFWCEGRRVWVWVRERVRELQRAWMNVVSGHARFIFLHFSISISFFCCVFLFAHWRRRRRKMVTNETVSFCTYPNFLSASSVFAKVSDSLRLPGMNFSPITCSYNSM
jgi:hypothetical protein